jgi:hypothetical protein
MLVTDSFLLDLGSLHEVRGAGPSLQRDGRSRVHPVQGWARRVFPQVPRSSRLCQ